MRILLALAILSISSCGFFVNVKNALPVENEVFVPDQFFLKEYAPSRISLSPAEIFKRCGSIQITACGTAYSNHTLSQKSADQAEFGSAVLLPPYNGRYYLLTAGHLDDSLFEIKYLYALFIESDEPPQEVELVVVDKILDWAILRFKDPAFIPRILPPTIRYSDELEHGERVYSIGSPLGYSHFINEGIISNPDELGLNYFFKQPKLIAHQCPINPGHSGGGLYDACGNLIGVNILGTNSPNIIPLAIPIEDIVKTLRRIKKCGYVPHAFLGCKVWLDKALSDQDLKIIETKRPEHRGVMITRIEEKSPAEKAGLKAGDVILSYDGRIPKHHSDLSRYVLCECEPEQKIKFRIDRYGEILEIEAKLIEVP